MTGKRFVLEDDNGMWFITDTENPQVKPHQLCTEQQVVGLLNALHEENMMLRSKHTRLIILLKDIINDLKRMDTKGYAEHIEKIKIGFLSMEDLE